MMGRIGFGLMIACVLVVFNAALGTRFHSTASEKAMRAQLVGTWRIVSASYNGEASDLAQSSVTYKQVTPAGFTWLSFKKDTKIVYRAGGGTWTLDGNTYAEKINYGMGDDFEVVRNTTASFQCKVDGDRWYSKGKLVNGTTVDEVWQRIPPAP
jgi:hypothetical protein